MREPAGKFINKDSAGIVYCNRDSKRCAGGVYIMRLKELNRFTWDLEKCIRKSLIRPRQYYKPDRVCKDCGNKLMAYRRKGVRYCGACQRKRALRNI